MIRVGFHTEAQSLVIEGCNVYPARSLTVHSASEPGYYEIWSLAGRSERKVRWSEVAPLLGEAVPFASEAETIAYLEEEFAKPEERGDAFVISIPIAEPGQTRLPLNTPPTQINTFRLEVNGVTYRAPLIAPSSIAVDWLNPDFPLAPSDDVTAVYS